MIEFLETVASVCVLKAHGFKVGSSQADGWLILNPALKIYNQANITVNINIYIMYILYISFTFFHKGNNQ